MIVLNSEFVKSFTWLVASIFFLINAEFEIAASTLFSLSSLIFDEIAFLLPIIIN